MTTLQLTPTFTVEELEQKVRDLGKQFPEKKYAFGNVVGNPCFYSKDKNGSGDGCRCIIGEALFQLGVPQEDLETIDANESNIELSVNKVLVNTFGFNEFGDFLSNVQFMQDLGVNWGDATTIKKFSINVRKNEIKALVEQV
jgi:hypothetical protein